MSDDRRLAELVGAALEPKPMDARARGAFRRAVEWRLDTREEPRVPWRSTFVLAASAAVAVALWFSLPSSQQPVEIAREPAIAPVREEPVTETPDERAEAPLLAAFADPDEILDEAEVSGDYLPDDYFVLASWVDELDG